MAASNSPTQTAAMEYFFLELQRAQEEGNFSRTENGKIRILLQRILRHGVTLRTINSLVSKGRLNVADVTTGPRTQTYVTLNKN